ncbi:MAG: ROK family transcriptional regulator [Lachnospiraceae bacterium]
MKRKSSSIEIKRGNRNRVFRFINKNDKTSIPDIAGTLGMSVPTALQMVNELKASRLVEEVGEFESTGGRKAKALASVKSAAHAVGIDITGNHIGMVLTDLSKEVLYHTRVRMVFCNEVDYFKEISKMLSEFLLECGLTGETVTGIGFSLPAIVDSSRSHIAFSHALKMRDQPLKPYLLHIPYPSVVLNDANAAALTECIHTEVPKNLVYLSLSNTVGGALVVGENKEENGEEGPGVFIGDNWRSGEFGHMVIHPEGLKCYCGKQGCLDAYCSASVLSGHTDGDLGLFFTELEHGNQEYEAIWGQYLENLAIAADTLRMCFDCDVVLGGYVGSYIKPYMERLRKIAAPKNIFGNTAEYLKGCCYPIESSALGAAIYQIEKYMENI